MRTKLYRKDVQSALRAILGFDFWGEGKKDWVQIDKLHERLLNAQGKLGQAPTNAFLTIQITKEELQMLCEGLTKLDEVAKDNPQVPILSSYDRTFHDKICNYLKWLEAGQSIPQNLNQQHKKP